MTPYRRILEADYGPDAENMSRGLRVASNGSALPNPRLLSNKLAHLEGNKTSSFMSLYVMQMGQFLNHDVSHTPMFPIPYNESCCGPMEEQNEQCIPISIPPDDPFFSNNINPNTSMPVNCMTMARSMTSPDIKCSMNIERQQVIL